MNILCAPDSFKESITATDAAQAMASGAQRADPSITADVCPVGDGGEGTLEALVTARGGSIHTALVSGPLGEPVQAEYGVLGDGATGVVELARASGLAIIPRDQRNPMNTTTFGTGQLVREAVSRGCREAIVCIGGSGTVDGGAGIAQALGAKFIDEDSNTITAPMTGGLLRLVARIERPPAANLPRIRIACDVTNPLCGPNGAAVVYGPQKGATPEQVKALDAGLAHLASVLGADPAMPGFGAAGGAALSLVMLCDAQMERGIELVLDALRFEERIRNTDLILTGEGSLDAQSLHGKATIGIAKAAAKHRIPVIAIVGRAGEGAERCVGPGLLERYVSLTDRYGVERSMSSTAECLRDATAAVLAARLSRPKTRR